MSIEKERLPGVGFQANQSLGPTEGLLNAALARQSAQNALANHLIGTGLRDVTRRNGRERKACHGHDLKSPPLEGD
jgi:hypothetical protein